MRGVRGDGGVGVPGAQVGEGAAFPRLGLAPVVGELDGVGVAGQGGEQATGADLGQLRRIPDQHQGPASGAGVGQQRRQGAGVDHRGLVDDEDPAGG